MKVSGYKIQHKLRELEASREVAAQQFGENIMIFDSQADKLDLREVFARFTSLERQIANLQVAQAQYNLAVQVNVLGEAMTLHAAVKLVGGAGRGEKMWRDVVKGKKDRYSSFRGDERNKDTEYAKRSCSVKDALEFSQQAASVAGALRQAIQLGNATEIELNIDEALFS